MHQVRRVLGPVSYTHLDVYKRQLLFAVPKDCEEYIEAKRLLKFLSYFLPVPADDVPRTSLLREFIGGGCYPG